jgi:hypothetical protein
MLVKIVTFQWNKVSFETSKLMKSAISGLILVIMAGCLASSELRESDKRHLIQRVSDRWQCLERNDYACAYQFLSPAYREVFSYEMYRNRYFSELERVLTGTKVVAYDRDAAVASVKVGVMSQSFKNTSSASRAIVVTPSTFSEAWLFGDGQWWYHEDP